MGQVKRATYTKALAADAVVTRDKNGRRWTVVTPRGKSPTRCEVVRIGGRDRVKIPTGDWYYTYTGLGGKTLKQTVGPDKHEAEAAMLEREKEIRAQRRGDYDGYTREKGLQKPLAEWLDDYLALLAAKRRGETYIRSMRQQVGLVLTAGPRPWATWYDVTADGLTTFLAWLRKNPRVARLKTLGPSALNGYRASINSFTKWLAAKLKVHNPIPEVPRFNPRLDVRRSVQPLTDAQLSQLVRAAGTHDRHRGMKGSDRAMLYLVAAYTGFRAGELAVLTPERFALDASRPGVLLKAGEDKAKRGVVQPLPPFLVEMLRPWLVGKKASERVWPGTWASQRNAFTFFRADLALAGVPTKDAEGRWLNFHGLRRKYISAVVRVVLNPKQAQILARHASFSMTFDTYASADFGGLADAVDRMPAPPAG
jgi:integrase